MKDALLKIFSTVAIVLVLNTGNSAIAAAPTADAGPDQTVAAGAECTATVTLAGTGADPDGTAVTFSWKWNTPDGENTASGAAPSIVLGLGTTVITLTVTDGASETATDTVSITVEDQTPPEVTLSASPKELWPPNHKMVPVTITVTVNDNCTAGGETTSKITSITSNEPDNGKGDGNTTGDFEITGDLTANLRAERAGPGSGRIYTITVSSTDGAGNVTESTVEVKVPHDQGHDDDDCIAVGDFKTYGQTAWGAAAEGENAGAYRDANFAAAFPDGVTIGAAAAGISGNSAKFTSAAAVDAFLPQTGTSAAFAVDHTDPTTTEAGALAGEVLALTLNVKFDLFDADFSASTTNLKDLVVHKEGDVCDGKTVQEVLDIANTILGGGTSTITAEQITACVAMINANFEGGAVNGGALTKAECLLTDDEWEDAPKELRKKEGKTHDKLLKIFDKDKDGKLKGKEKSALRKALKEHKKSKKGKKSK